ncbi:MAG: thiamine-phosphate kinase [Thioalkalivibrionaceae bacterium]
MRSEFELIERYFKRPSANQSDGKKSVHSVSNIDFESMPLRSNAVGIGDDAALWTTRAPVQVASVDTMVLGRHWFPGCPPAVVAWRALAAAASDLAAMGARPRGFLLSLTLPDSRQPDPLWTKECSEAQASSASSMSSPVGGGIDSADESIFQNTLSGRSDRSATMRLQDAVERCDWLAEFSAGLTAAASAFEIPLLGGDTTKGPLAVSISVFGERPSTPAKSKTKPLKSVEDAVDTGHPACFVDGYWSDLSGACGASRAGGMLRSEARPGDDVWVGGPLGGAAMGLAVLRRERDLQRLAKSPDDTPPEIQRWCWPRARLKLGRQLLGRVGAVIDISDGLLAEARHIAKASGVIVEIDLDRVLIDTEINGSRASDRSADNRSVSPDGSNQGQKSEPCGDECTASGGSRLLDSATSSSENQPGTESLSESFVEPPDSWIETRVAALSGGEDFELLWTAPPDFDGADLVGWGDEVETACFDSIKSMNTRVDESPSSRLANIGPQRIGHVTAISEGEAPAVVLRRGARVLAQWPADEYAEHRQKSANSRIARDESTASISQHGVSAEEVGETEKTPALRHEENRGETYRHKKSTSVGTSALSNAERLLLERLTRVGFDHFADSSQDRLDE